MVPSRWIEHLSSGYKSEVIAIILRRHIYWVGSQLLPIYTIAISWAYCKSPRCQRWDSNPLNTNLWHMARAESNDLPWTFIQPRFSKPVPYLSAIPAYLAHDRAFEAHRLSPTHRFQVGSCTLQVYRAFKTNTFIFIELTFCPLSTWKSIGTEPLGN